MTTQPEPLDLASLRNRLAMAEEMAAGLHDVAVRIAGDDLAELLEIAELARQWVGCEPDSLPDRWARRRMEQLVGGRR